MRFAAFLRDRRSRPMFVPLLAVLDHQFSCLRANTSTCDFGHRSLTRPAAESTPSLAKTRSGKILRRFLKTKEAGVDAATSHHGRLNFPYLGVVNESKHLIAPVDCGSRHSTLSLRSGL